jgi:hypothetical protein
MEDLIQKKLTPNDHDLLREFSDLQRCLRPAGNLSDLESAFAVTKMEVVVGDKYEGINVSGQGVAIGRGAHAEVSGSSNAPTTEDLPAVLSSLAQLIRTQVGKPGADVEAALVEAAAKRAEAGDKAGAAGILKKSADWVFDMAKATGSSVLAAFLKSEIGI